MRFSKYVIVFLVVVLICIIPCFEVLANNATNNQASGSNDTVNDILSMLGGGGIGVVGSKFMHAKTQVTGNKNPTINGLTDQVANLIQNDALKEVKDDLYKQLAVLKKQQKILHSKLNNIEFFLGKKYQEFDRKDTLH